jgi:hypothetical protein
MAKAINETGEITCFSHMLWPTYGGDYPRYDVVGERSMKEGIYELLRDPSKQWGSPLVYFQLKAAMHGVVLKLRSQGTRNLTNSLTMIGSASMIELMYHEIYHYTLSIFLLRIHDMPVRHSIREATRGPRFGGKGPEEADDGAEVQAVVLRENVSLVPPDEPEEPTPVEGEEEVEREAKGDGEASGEEESLKDEVKGVYVLQASREGLEIVEGVGSEKDCETFMEEVEGVIV